MNELTDSLRLQKSIEEGLMTSNEVYAEIMNLFEDLMNKGIDGPVLEELIENIHGKNKFRIVEVSEDNYCGTLDLGLAAFYIFDALKELAISSIYESSLLKGVGLGAVSLPGDALECFKELGIKLDDEPYILPSIDNLDLQRTMADLLLRIKKAQDLMMMALEKLKATRSSLADRE